jgi:PIN domain nuclease of toxin-antitoxin system
LAQTLTCRVQTVTEAEGAYVSAASLWEIAIKVRLGKLKADLDSITQLVQSKDFQELPVHFRLTLIAAMLPINHGDPFDRLLIAQAMTEPLHLLTADARLKPYSNLVVCV